MVYEVENSSYMTLQYLMPFVEQEKYQLSLNCRLHPDNDIFRDQELHKIHVDINEWRCGYCTKSFRSEKYLDQHFDNRHFNLLNIVCRSLTLNFHNMHKLTKFVFLDGYWLYFAWFDGMWDWEGNESKKCVVECYCCMLPVISEE